MWRDEKGDPVDLADEGVHLPEKPDPNHIEWFHDGMKIRVSNRVVYPEGAIRTNLSLIDKTGVNCYKRLYENITYSENLILQTGSRTKDGINFKFRYSARGIGELKADLDCSAGGLGLSKLTLSEQEKANYAVDSIDCALNKVSMVRAAFGAARNRLEHKTDDLNVSNENITAAESGIRDTNIAEEMMNFTKLQIVANASRSMLAQANSLPQQVIGLIGQ